jgi:hypothetical protein
VKFDVGLNNGLLFGIVQETIYVIDMDEETEEPTGKVDKGSAIHIYFLLFRVSLIFW